MYPQRSVMTCGLATALEPPHFNHAPVRGATSGSSLRLCSLPCFNPRTRVGCDGTVNTKNMTSVQFQSTHPRGVRRGRPGNVHRDDSVSIHAPAWGATGRTGQGRAGKYLVSIHAPAWGATCYLPGAVTDRGSFNPRTRVGCDPSNIACVPE